MDAGLSQAGSALPSRPDWYKANKNDPTLDVAREAFEAAKAKFSTTLTADKRKAAFVDFLDGLAELRTLVDEAHAKYLVKHEKNKARKWLARFSKRVMLYSSIVDVLVSAHPEYAALVWGAMKLVFLSVVNHENLVVAVTKGLAKMADLLPVCEVTACLYPTAAMKRALAEIYAHVIRFLVRAYSWSEDMNGFMRALQSIARPRELQYDDILEDIAAATGNLRVLAVTASQAETRDMHVLLIEVKEMMLTHHQINTSAQLNTNTVLSDLQFSQILTHLSQLPLAAPDKVLQTAVVLAGRLRRKCELSLSGGTGAEPVWKSAAFQAWVQAMRPHALITIHSLLSSRLRVRAFLANTVTCIRDSDVPVLWALQMPGSSTPTAPGSAPSSPDLSLVDLLKYLTHQALQYGGPHTESSLAISCARVQTARDHDHLEWLRLLAASVARLRRVYIVVDTELLAHSSSSSSPSLSDAFSMLFRELAAAASKTSVKVLLASYGSALRSKAADPSPDSDMSILQVGTPKVPVSRAVLMRRGRGKEAMRGAMRRGIGTALGVES